MKIEDLLRENIRNLKPYSSARDEFDGQPMIQLDANENPFDNGLNRYPDPYQTQLKQKIGAWKDLNPENLVLGNGSDELIDLIIRAFCEPGLDEVIGLQPSYGMYQVCCDVNNVNYVEIPMNQDFNFSAQEVLNVVNEKTKLIFLCSPNNPSGNTLDKNQIELLLTSFNGLVVMDEAYIDFSLEESWSKTLDKYPQIIVLQTFSKAFGLAGIRLGMAWCSQELVQIYNRIKPPYNVSQLTQVEALKALEEPDQIKDRIKDIVSQRKSLVKSLESLSIVKRIYPSDANFLLIQFENADKTYEYLMNKGIVVRNRSKQYNCQNCLRITVGTSNENEQLIAQLKAYENEESTIHR